MEVRRGDRILRKDQVYASAGDQVRWAYSDPAEAVARGPGRPVTRKQLGYAAVGTGALLIAAEIVAWSLYARYRGGDVTSNRRIGDAYYASHAIAGASAIAASVLLGYFFTRFRKPRTTRADDRDGARLMPSFGASSRSLELGLSGRF